MDANRAGGAQSGCGWKESRLVDMQPIGIKDPNPAWTGFFQARAEPRTTDLKRGRTAAGTLN